jgi:hypothetical protein
MGRGGPAGAGSIIWYSEMRLLKWSIMTVKYRTKDGQADYEFSFEPRDGNWRAYIVCQPSYRSRATDAVSTHRLTDDQGRRYVCWRGALRTKEEAKQVAALWSDRTQAYIKYGTPIQ